MIQNADEMWNGEEKHTENDVKKRKLSANKGNSALKRHCCSSLILAVQDQNHDTQADSSSSDLKSVKTKFRCTEIPLSSVSNTVISSSTSEQTWRQGNEELKWEIKMILKKREIMSGMKYKIQWKDTWLLIDALRHAQKLLCKFEHEHKWGRPAHKYKV